MEIPEGIQVKVIQHFHSASALCIRFKYIAVKLNSHVKWMKLKNSVAVYPRCFSSGFSLRYLCTSQVLAGGYQSRIGGRPEEKIE